MKKLKKAFTLTELVIVIAVIAILAAVLIPTYTSLVRKANISADTQLAKNMNNLISDQTTMDGVIDTLAENGYGIGKLNPTTEGHRFLWDETSKQIIFVDNNYKIVYKAKDINLDEANLWLTVKKPSEVVTTKKFNLNYYLTQDSSKNFTLTTISDFDTGDNVLSGNLTINSTADGEATIDGTFNGTVTINTPNADIEQFGSVKTLDVTAVADNSLEVNGFVDALNLTAGKVDMQTSAYVKTMTVKSENAKVVNGGIIENITKDDGINAVDFTNNGGMVVTNTAGVTNPTTANYVLQLGSLTELEGFRDAVNGGATFADMEVKLTADIELNDGWTPIGVFTRDVEAPESPIKGFQGTFDGNNKTISNLNNDGYNPQDAVTFKNPTTIGDKEQYSFGLFGYVSNAEIKNLTLTNVAINIETGSIYGDSVAALVAYSYGDLTIDNVVVGSASTTDASAVSAYDGVAGIVGRAYGEGKAVSTVTITDSINYAAVTTNEKGAGIIGYANTSVTVSLNGCANHGVITCDALGLANKLGYAAGLVASHGSSPAISISYCSNTGAVTAKNTTQGSQVLLEKLKADAYVAAQSTTWGTAQASTNTGVIKINDSAS